MIINRIYENQNLLSLQFVSFLVGLRTYQHPCIRHPILFKRLIINKNHRHTQQYLLSNNVFTNEIYVYFLPGHYKDIYACVYMCMCVCVYVCVCVCGVCVCVVCICVLCVCIRNLKGS